MDFNQRHDFNSSYTPRTIRDGLKATEILLDVVRHIVRKLRTPNLLAVIRRRGGLLPILDMPTRWGSTFLMAKRLLELKDHVQDLAAAASDLLLSDANWRKLEELATTLKMPYDVTVRLQSAAITPGSFLKEWTALKSILNKQESTLAQSIENSMDRREEKLFDNNIFLAAVLVDSRYRILLKDDQVERGKQGLREVIYRLRSRSHCGGSQDTPMLDTSPSSTDEDEFEKELDKMERSRRLSVVASLQTDVDDDITTMLAMGRVKTSPFVAAEAYPNGLKPAAMTLTAMPVSQVSVERLFSGLKFLLSDQRASMKADLVEALLFLRTNTTR